MDRTARPLSGHVRPRVARALGSAPRLSVGAALVPAFLLRVPWGAILVVAVTAFLLLLGYRLFRRWALAGSSARTTLQPTQEGRPPPRTALTPGGRDWDESADAVSPAARAGADASGSGGADVGSAPSAAAEPPVAFLWRPETGLAPIEGYASPKSVAQRSPAAGGFGLRVILIFLGVAVALALLHRVVFLAMDEFVRELGALLYWPRPWPGVLIHPTLERTLPDFVLLTYLAMLLSICLSTRVFADPRYSGGQRRNAALILVGYILAEALTDAVGFAFPERLVASAFLLARALLGGAALALLLLDILILPAPIAVTPVRSRDRFAIVITALVAILSLFLSLVVLVLAYQYLGFGRTLVSFAVLLLLPFLGLFFFGVLGRLLYSLELRQHPLPPLESFHPSVSIIIPAYNEAPNVGAAIASADDAAALYPGTTEILVANDGSTDATAEAARRAVSRLRHAQGAVLDLPHGGKSNALNAALRAARGNVIVRIDADSRISTQRGFGEMVRHLADTDVGGVQGLILPLQTTGWTRKLRFLEIAWNHLYLRRAQMATRTAQVVDGAFCAFRREDLLRVGGWVAWNGEDTEITLRLQRQGFRMRFETGAAAFEDVPADFAGLRKQRVRWNRGGVFAHRRHLGGLFSEPLEFGGMAMLMWLTFFVRGGLRGLIWVYAIILAIFAGLPTILDILIISLTLLVPRGVAMGYYLIRLGRWRYLPYIFTWPVTGTVKQLFSLEAYGTMLPGAPAEFAD